MKITQIQIDEIMWLSNCAVFLKNNTIFIGKNNSSKARILKILFHALKCSLQKLKKDSNYQQWKF